MNRGFVQKVLGLPFSARQVALRKSRRPLSKPDFIDRISRSGGDVEAAGIIHSKLQDWIYVEEFTAYPDDSFASVFGIAEEELDEDMILAVIKHLDLTVPPKDEIAKLGSLDNATDVARLVALARITGE